MKLPDYTEAALLAHGIPYAERGTIPPSLRSRERKAFVSKWATLRPGIGGGRRFAPQGRTQPARQTLRVLHTETQESLPIMSADRQRPQQAPGA